MRSNPNPSRVTLHAFPLLDKHLRHAWGDTLYQVRLCFDEVESRGRCEIVLAAHRGVLQAPADSAVPLETEELP